MKNSDPLSVLLSVKEAKELKVDKELIQQCYQLQKEHQYDKDRSTLKKMESLIESALNTIKDEQGL